MPQHLTSKQLLVFILVLIFKSALADVCVPKFESDTAYSKAIFVGKVVGIERAAYWSQGHPLTVYTFEITESFKGVNPFANYLSVISPVYGCCSPYFHRDSVYLVFANAYDPIGYMLFCNDCSMTGLLSTLRAEYQRLGPSQKHKQNKRFFDSRIYFQINKYARKNALLALENNQLQSEVSTLSAQLRNLIILTGFLFFIAILLFFRRYRRTTP